MSLSFLATVRGLWVRHDPMRFVGAGGATLESYEHQAYVTALCVDEILSGSDAEKIVSTILRHEFGIHSAPWPDAEFALRVQCLAQDLFRAVQQHAARPITDSHPAR